jgi:hypothetical protein
MKVMNLIFLIGLLKVEKVVLSLLNTNVEFLTTKTNAYEVLKELLLKIKKFLEWKSFVSKRTKIKKVLTINWLN